MVTIYWKFQPLPLRRKVLNANFQMCLQRPCFVKIILEHYYPTTFSMTWVCSLPILAYRVVPICMCYVLKLWLCPWGTEFILSLLFFFFGHSMQLAGILVSPIRDRTWALSAEKAQSANQCTSGEVPVSTILNLNRFTGPRANFLNSAFSGSVQARQIGYGLSGGKKEPYVYVRV